MIWIIPNRNRSRPQSENVEGEDDGDEERTNEGKWKEAQKHFTTSRKMCIRRWWSTINSFVWDKSLRMWISESFSTFASCVSSDLTSSFFWSLLNLSRMGRRWELRNWNSYKKPSSELNEAFDVLWGLTGLQKWKTINDNECEIETRIYWQRWITWRPIKRTLIIHPDEFEWPVQKLFHAGFSLIHDVNLCIQMKSFSVQQNVLLAVLNSALNHEISSEKWILFTREGKKAADCWSLRCLRNSPASCWLTLTFHSIPEVFYNFFSNVVSFLTTSNTNTKCGASWFVFSSSLWVGLSARLSTLKQTLQMI